MREKHRIGFYCELCDEYCLFQEELEEHMDSHATETECEEKLEEYTEVECVQCKQKFESEDEIKEHEITSEEGNKEEEMETPVMEIKCMQCNMTFESEEEIIAHENDAKECDQCGKWICDGISLKRHNKKEHEITRQKGNKEEDMEIDGTKIECVECNEKFKSTNKIIEHITKNECGGLTCCE